MNQIHANCRVSMPILKLDQQHVLMNGFAFSIDQGLIHQAISNNQGSWQQWLGTQQ